MRTLSPSHKDFVRLEDLIKKLKTSGRAGEYDLLVEHLQTACAYELGAMPIEEEHNLLMALTAAEEVSDQALRSEIQETIGALRRNTVSEPAGQHVPQVHDLAANYGAPS